ncbi:MAG: site-2 protease family protein [Ignavibacteria bacterium]|nr:site-2 protease family protein [Ignavibacteria bacterium]
MDNYNDYDRKEIYTEQRKKYGYILNIVLFIFTFFTTTLAGTFWLNKDPYQLENFHYGLEYSALILLVITFHEFGHYFAARYHKVDVTLPYYIPFPFLFLNPFGTMGAVIKMKSPTHSRKSLFDIGVAGPISGWIVTVLILVYGYLNLPSVEYLYDIHPEYRLSGISLSGLTFGHNLVTLSLEKLVHLVNPDAFIPPMNEIYHYPFLCVGWFGLLITALNLMPVGQLDGGHISYSMFGEKHKYPSYVVISLLIFFGLLGVLQFYYPKLEIGSLNWFVWALLIIFVIKIKHPPIIHSFDEPLGKFRTFLGWFSFFIFIVSFCPIPISEL